MDHYFVNMSPNSSRSSNRRGAVEARVDLETGKKYKLQHLVDRHKLNGQVGYLRSSVPDDNGLFVIHLSAREIAPGRFIRDTCVKVEEFQLCAADATEKVGFLVTSVSGR